jgi:hypothetical protein
VLQKHKVNDWNKMITAKNVITKKFKPALKLVEPEKLKFNTHFMKIASHIYFMFYHPYQHLSEPVSYQDMLLQQDQKQIENSSETFFKEFDSDSNWSDIISGTEPSSSNDKLANNTVKEFSFTENSSNPNNITYSMVLKTFLSENADDLSMMPHNQNDTPSDVFIKLHSCLYNSDQKKMMVEISDLVEGVMNLKGERNFGFGVDVLRLFAASFDQGKIVIA